MWFKKVKSVFTLQSLSYCIPSERASKSFKVWIYTYLINYSRGLALFEYVFIIQIYKTACDKKVAHELLVSKLFPDAIRIKSVQRLQKLQAQK